MLLVLTGPIAFVSLGGAAFVFSVLFITGKKVCASRNGRLSRASCLPIANRSRRTEPSTLPPPTSASPFSLRCDVPELHHRRLGAATHAASTSQLFQAIKLVKFYAWCVRRVACRHACVTDAVCAGRRASTMWSSTTAAARSGSSRGAASLSPGEDQRGGSSRFDIPAQRVHCGLLGAAPHRREHVSAHAARDA
jgi:hypothetical protein